MTTRPGHTSDRFGDDPVRFAIDLMGRIRRDGEWESAQTHESLLAYLVEESYELADAVAGGNRDEIVSELGDLLLQVLFHASIGAEREGDPFDVDDVAVALLDKLRDRAPYWFAEPDADGRLVAPSAAEQDRLWQEAKARANARAAEAAPHRPADIFEGISWTQPALALGQQVLARARRAGVPDELVPADLRVVQVAPEEAGPFDASVASVELDYRARVLAFVAAVESGEIAPPR